MLQKQSIDVPFAQGLDTKTDPKRVQIGKFLQLQNTVFQKGGLLQKRNGYGQLAALPNDGTTYSYLSTLNGNLTAIGQNIAAYDAPNQIFVNKGAIQPVSLKTLPLLRNNLNQHSVDIAVAANGLICTVYLEDNGGSIANKYVIADSATGQNITAPINIPVSSGAVSGGMRVFLLGSYFVIVFTNTISGVAHLQYIAISTSNPNLVTSNADIATNYVPSTHLSWDGFVSGGNLYIAYDTTAGGQSVQIRFLSSSLILSAPTTFVGETSVTMSVTADPNNVAIYATYFDGAGSIRVFAVSNLLAPLFGPISLIGGAGVGNITSIASTQFAPNINLQVFYDVIGGPVSSVILSGTYGSPSVGTPYDVLRGVSLASKVFPIIADKQNFSQNYVLMTWNSLFQPTYFLVNATTSRSGIPEIVAKLAYQNGGGALPNGLPNVSVKGSSAQLPYLFKDLIASVNKNTNVPAGTAPGGVYSQTGINLASINFTASTLVSSEIGNDLHISGGFLWMYDGYLPVEHNFFLWPENASGFGASAVVSNPGGSVGHGTYFYQVVYEWSDNQGNIFRSAPSVPLKVTVALDSSFVTLTIPTLRVTMKTSNPVKITVYRWSTNQLNYFQVGNLNANPVTNPIINSTITDTVTFTDTSNDTDILGNNLIYTTGGVLEDVNAPASDNITLFDTRLWLVDAEDRNLLWYSKQVIEATPVEMSDLLTIFVPPTTATAGTTGPITALSVLDDKLIIFKRDAAFYINGTGPDNTGSNVQYSQAIFITATVGCTNQKSIVLMPNGLMFQSDKGIWLLGRDLNTQYIGAPVESFTQSANVLSAVNVPATNQVRFTLDSGVTLMYDYFYGQWGTFVNVPNVSSTIFQGLHTFIDKHGKAYQETPGVYLDGSEPVLMMFQTSALRLGELQHYQRAYFFYLLGQYFSPHKLYVSLFYDYAQAPSQSVIITPVNGVNTYGSAPYYGSGGYGGSSQDGLSPEIESWRVFFAQQRCQAVSIQIQEIFDASLGLPAGAGFTLSGISAICGFKKPYRPQPAALSAG